MARKDDAPAISLFSFQDIITSLTGIMFLVVLLLVLSMMDMRKSDDPSQTEQTRQLAEAAAKQVQELQQQVTALREQERHFQERIRELKKLDPDTLWIRCEELRREMLRQQNRNRLVRLAMEETKQKREQLQQQCRELQENTSKEDTLIADLDRKIRILEEEVQKKHAQTVKVQKALKYVVENNTTFSPVLVECTASGVRILDCSNGQETDLRIEQGNFEQRRQKFLEWVQMRNRNDEYYTILLKPESADYEELLYDLKNLQKSRGLELLPANDVSLWEGTAK